ncbi:MAG: YbaB/EbfC family nucleoid-associated protein [Nitrospinaceae bacterium]
MEKDWSAMFKQAQEMQAKIAEIQKDLAHKKVEVTTGGGMVTVTANGLNEILSVRIDDDLINMEDREVLEDLITGAINEVNRKVKEMAQQEMARLTGGIKIPGLFSNP